MKKLVLLFMVIFGFQTWATENDIFGVWQNAGGNQVKIYKENNQVVGDLIKLAEPVYPKGHKLEGQDKVDLENPDASKRGKKLEGLRILWGFSFDGEKYKDGKIYDPKSGKTYYSKMEVKNGVLKLRGSLDKVGLLGRTEEWTRK